MTVARPAVVHTTHDIPLTNIQSRGRLRRETHATSVSKTAFSQLTRTNRRKAVPPHAALTDRDRPLLGSTALGAKHPPGHQTTDNAMIQDFSDVRPFRIVIIGAGM